MNGLVELPKNKKAIILTDIHGDFSIFKSMEERVVKSLSFGNYFICTGDYIHGENKDDSIKLIETMIHLKARFPRNVYILLGNHEWSHVVDLSVYRSGKDQTKNFFNQMKSAFPLKFQDKLNEYIKFWKSLPVAVKIGDILITHAAPDKKINTADFLDYDVMDVRVPTDKFYGLLWARPRVLGYVHDIFVPYDEDDINDFLMKMYSEISIVGHTHVEKFHIIDNQFILNSMSRVYLELDLSEDYSVDDLKSCVKEVWE